MSKLTKAEKLMKAEQELAMLSHHGKKLKEKGKEVQPIEHDFPNEILVKCIRPVCDFKLKTRSSDRIKQRLEMVKHLFVKYPVPKILEQVWYKHENNRMRGNNHTINNNNKIVQTEYHDWYICAGTGGSLHKEYLKDFMTKKETHVFMACIKPLTINEAIYYATAVCAGASDGIAFRIARSKLGKKQKENVFWRDCARFFATNVPESIEQLDDIIDFLEHKKNENRDFSIFGQGFTIKTLLVRVKDWHYELRRIKEHSGYSWKGFDIPNGEYIRKDEKGNEIVWTITQIVKGKDLAEEGNKMHHCVYSYRNKCINGTCSIWSLRVRPNVAWGYTEEKRVATIEVGSSYSIVQARGFANRTLKPNEQNILAAWCFENNIDYYKY